MLKLKTIKPLFSQVLVTENLYEKDDFDEAGIIVAKKGDIKPYQTVIAVSDEVKTVKPGDVVSINFYKYAEFKEDPNSVKASGGNSVVKLRLKEVELLDNEGNENTCFMIDARDINYILTDYDEVFLEPKKNKANIILPNKKIRV